MLMYRELPVIYREKINSEYLNYMVNSGEAEKKLSKYKQSKANVMRFHFNHTLKELEYKELEYFKGKISNNLYNKIITAQRIYLSLNEYMSVTSFEQLYQLLAIREGKVESYHFNATHLVISNNLYKRIMDQQEVDCKTLNTYSLLAGVKVDENLQFRECIIEEGFFVKSNTHLYNSFKENTVYFSIIMSGRKKEFRSGFVKKEEVINNTDTDLEVLNCSYGISEYGVSENCDGIIEASADQLEWIEKNYDSIKREIRTFSIFEIKGKDKVKETNIEKKGA